MDDSNIGTSSASFLDYCHNTQDDFDVSIPGKPMIDITKSIPQPQICNKIFCLEVAYYHSIDFYS